MGNEAYKKGRPCYGSQCKEAIQNDPTYCRAHHRLATIYLRLGEAKQALDHCKNACQHANSDDNVIAQPLYQCLKRCIDARKSNEYSLLQRQSMPLELILHPKFFFFFTVYALQTEAFRKLHRHQEAYTSHSKGPNFAIESCINFFGMAVSAYLLMIKALVYMVSGRLDEAVSAAQHVSRHDPSNKEISLVVKQTRTASSA
ncbi:Tetratricopeptide repeat-containing protein, putative isoform 2 [Hibiscus syriacus]|uniref:Tetratricopeptide repeat-containing protein, putative isoform 2 n=2 Tax=Hibiscus syriacus TaxID=106335 RepID=A0A6A2Y619_HIBSY|nr:Tetratricopeptide repeat-containing protein, putative isoform 2 [Hibiscus syriacus]